MKNQAQQRLLFLQHFLLTQTDEDHPTSVSDILRFWKAHGIEAGRKSVYSDISLLTEFGMDIICIKSTQNHYFVASRLFELPELKLLVDAVEASHFVTPKKSAALIEKLGQLTSSFRAGQLNRPIYIEGTAKADNEMIYYSIDTIQTAIQQGKKITFQYYERSPQYGQILKHSGYHYILSPYALIWSRDNYYVVGWSEKHKKVAQFRVDRMVGVTGIEQPATLDENFDPTTYVQTVFEMYDDEIQDVELHCKNELIGSVIDRFGSHIQIDQIDPEHFRTVVKVSPSPPFFGWVFTFGGAIQIAGPKNVVKEMCGMAKWIKSDFEERCSQ